LALLSALGETINLMTLGGLALAIGILVDDATVTIENIQSQMALGKPTEQAILDGAQEIALPAFVSTLCICIVFLLMVYLTGVARYLFVPLAEAVVFAMLATVLGHRFIMVILFLAFCAGTWLLVPKLGENFFPTVDAGQFRLHVRAYSGMRIEETTRLVDQVENVIQEVVPAGELAGILDNIGIPSGDIPPTYSDSGLTGTRDADLLVSLAHGHKPTEGYVRRLRSRLSRDFPGVTFFSCLPTS